MNSAGSTPARGHRIGRIDFSVMPLARAIEYVLDASSEVTRGTQGHPGLAVHFCNAYNVALARSDPDYAALLGEADVVFSDGVPITWVGRRAYPGVADAWERVYGPDVMRGVLDRSTAEGPRHYLLGGSPETLSLLEARIAEQHPNASIVGAESPPYRPPTPEELAARDDRIRSSGAAIVWVGLGTPRQDTEVRRLASEVPVTAMAVGAAFDFLAGTKAQAPLWMQRSGLEWAFRLASEPGRLGRRYVWGNSVFAAEAIRTLRTSRRASTAAGGSATGA
jgi:N-acetylglucosaminyldiphosphoundecaprenol N-acetyl-beta-D-mannosaminyltransferase